MEQTVFTILQKIHKLQKGQAPLVIAIDGRCGAGKTTLAQNLSQELSCSVIHLDHFFLRPQQRTPERLKQAGGNFDRERFLSEVIPFLRQNQPFSYRPFDCKTQTLSEPVMVKPDNLVIVEGFYCCHPSLFPFYDLTIFLDVCPQEQIRRITCRNGENMAQIFQTRWIPMEEAYFSAFSIQQKCDLFFSKYPQ